MYFYLSFFFQLNPLQVTDVHHFGMAVQWHDKCTLRVKAVRRRAHCVLPRQHHPEARQWGEERQGIPLVGQVQELQDGHPERGVLLSAVQLEQVLPFGVIRLSSGSDRSRIGGSFGFYLYGGMFFQCWFDGFVNLRMGEFWLVGGLICHATYYCILVQYRGQGGSAASGWSVLWEPSARSSPCVR